MKRRKLIFLATEDWFVRSHFLPLLRRAVAEGFEVLVWARNSGALASEPDVRVIDAAFERRSVSPWDLARQARELKIVLDQERPALIHAIALKPMLQLLQANYRAAGRILALTGRGYLAANTSPWAKFLSAGIQSRLRKAMEDGGALALVENIADGRWIAGPGVHERVMLMPGAGVDPDLFPLSPEPASGLVIGVLSRLIRSKGIDLAVEAVRVLKARGVKVTLTIGGAADQQNPDCYTDAEINRWRQTPGVELVGPVGDAPKFWANVHIACLPSRGGEGLPRTLLEAASCGRPIVTSNVPGCADLVAGEEIGLIARRGDVGSLAHALEWLALTPDMRRSMGAAGRAKILKGYTEMHAADVAARAWQSAQRP